MERKCAWLLILNAFCRRNTIPWFANEWAVLQCSEERLPNGQTCTCLWWSVSLTVTSPVMLPLQWLWRENVEQDIIICVGCVAVMRSWRSAGMRSLRRGLSSPSWSTVWGTCWQRATRRYFIYDCCIQLLCPLVAGKRERKLQFMYTHTDSSLILNNNKTFS